MSSSVNFLLHKLKLFELTPPRLRAKMPQQIYGFKWSLHFLVRTCCSCGFNGRWHLVILPIAKPKPQQQRHHNLTLHLASPPHHTSHDCQQTNTATLPPGTNFLFIEGITMSLLSPPLQEHACYESRAITILSGEVLDTGRKKENQSYVHRN